MISLKAYYNIKELAYILNTNKSRLYKARDANVNDVFNACMKAKNEIWEYIISLELPTKPDYEV